MDSADELVQRVNEQGGKMPTFGKGLFFFVNFCFLLDNRIEFNDEHGKENYKQYQCC